jgi:hypothetical protein
MSLVAVTHTLPAQWASYLVNGDASVFEDWHSKNGPAEKVVADGWLVKNQLKGCSCMVANRDSEPQTGCDERKLQEPYFTWGPIGPQVLGGDALDFVFMVGRRDD